MPEAIDERLCILHLNIRFVPRDQTSLEIQTLNDELVSFSRPTHPNCSYRSHLSMHGLCKIVEAPACEGVALWLAAPTSALANIHAHTTRDRVCCFAIPVQICGLHPGHLDMERRVLQAWLIQGPSGSCSHCMMLQTREQCDCMSSVCFIS